MLIPRMMLAAATSTNATLMCRYSFGDERANPVGGQPQAAIVSFRHDGKKANPAAWQPSMHKRPLLLSSYRGQATPRTSAQSAMRSAQAGCDREVNRGRSAPIPSDHPNIRGASAMGQPLVDRPFVVRLWW